MHALDGLIACAGNWRGANTLQDPNTGSAEESPATAAVTPILDGRFVQLDYTWGYQGKPQAGSLLIGFEKETEAVTAHWIDSWHNGDRVMACEGSRPSGPAIEVRGTYPAPPGPDWGWRTEITPDGERSLRLVMFNLWPDGEREERAMETHLARA
jgi:hypothetical protein